jgi:hypothetical protein
MAKKSFGIQLAEGFVRSTVNQVGRQTGNVIANNIYGDAHSTPFKIITEANKNVYLTEPIEEPTEYQFDKPIYVLWFLLYFIFWPIPFIYGIYLYFSKKVNCYNFSTHEAYVEDRRYKTGVRSVGIRTIKNNISFPIDECSEELVEQKKKAALIILSPVIAICALFIIFSLFVSITTNF